MNNGVRDARALVYTAPGVAEIQKIALPPMEPGMVEIETAYTAISRGTERVVFNGLVPQSEHERMRAPFQIGHFPFPVRYGYCAAGRVVDGPPDLCGQTVFALCPHQSRLRIPAAAATIVPEGIPASRAILAANMETALNAAWDADLAPGTKVLVIGAGLVGLLTAFVLMRFSFHVTITDIAPDPLHLASELDLQTIAPHNIPPASFHAVFHTSAQPAGLQSGIDALDFEGLLVEMSWYGERPVSVVLGGNFHANRLRMISSQVGHVAPARRQALSLSGRLAHAMRLLDDPRLDALITEEIAFDAVPSALGRILGPGAQGITTRIRYD